jgi:hypothetical protein
MMTQRERCFRQCLRRIFPRCHNTSEFKVKSLMTIQYANLLLSKQRIFVPSSLQYIVLSVKRIQIHVFHSLTHLIPQ